MNRGQSTLEAREREIADIAGTAASNHQTGLSETADSRHGMESADPPVRFSDISFSDIKYSDVVRGINFNHSLPGNRTCAYFGNKGYSYGRISHQPAEYPVDHPVFTRIFDSLSAVDPSFTPSNYTCLATNYSNGQVFLGMHSDDEEQTFIQSLLVPNAR